MRNALLSTQEFTPTRPQSLLGLVIATTIIFLWFSSLIVLLSIDISQLSLFFIVSAVVVRTFLHTGIFITAHDAMHGTVFQQNRHINDFIGSVATRLYVLLPYKTLLEKHRLHHRYPASSKDPDFCEQGQHNPWIWYLDFMKGYLVGKQTWVVFLGMALIFALFRWGFDIPASNLFLFWVLPILFSSIQLFYFGIFLPHRRPKGGYTNRHRAKSTYYDVFWSLIACYHFGYHWEHHEFPHLPWYKLPSVVKS